MEDEKTRVVLPCLNPHRWIRVTNSIEGYDEVLIMRCDVCMKLIAKWKKREKGTATKRRKRNYMWEVVSHDD